MTIIFKAYLQAIRPATLLASLGPVLLGLTFAYASLNYITAPFIALATILSALFMQIATNLVNDYFDHKDGIDDSFRKGPKRVTGPNQLNLSQVQSAYRWAFLISFLFGIYLIFHGGVIILILGISSILAAYCYTAGPYPFSRHALGELTAFIFFGPLAVCGSYYLQTHLFSWKVLFYGATPGFISAAIMAINNLRDRDTDKLSGKHTLAGLVSGNFAKKLPVIFIFLSILPASLQLFINLRHSYLVAVLLPLSFIKNWHGVMNSHKGEELNQNLKNTGKYLFLSCLVNGLIIIYEAQI